MLPSSFHPIKVSYDAYQIFKKYHFVKRDVAFPSHCYVFQPNIAIIVYAYPALSHRIRRLATSGMFNYGNRSEIAKRLNRNIRTIARVVVHPKWRNRRIATKLIAMTLPMVNMPFIDCSTNLFGGSKCFSNAGMQRFMTKPPDIWFQVKAMYKQLGFERVQNLNFRHQRIFFDNLNKNQVEVFRKVAKLYLGNVKVYKISDSNFELHQKLISRFDQVPVYYHWRNPELSILD